MRRNDLILFGLTAAVWLAAVAPALLRPGLILGGFGDVEAYHYPLQHLTASTLQAGRLPFWNPYIFAGLPHLANTQTAMWYPPAVVLRLFPLGWAFTVYASWHVLWGALGMQLFLRRRGLGAGGAAVLAAVFALSPFLVYRIAQGIPTHLAALSWAPWCWLALESRRRGLLAAAWALQAFSGHPQFAVINAGAMAVAAAAVSGRAAAAGALLRGGLWAALLTVVLWAPMLEFLGESNRGDLPAIFSRAYAMPGAALSTLLSPSLAGTPLAGTFAGVPSVFFESYALYLGWLPLALAAWAWSRREAGAAALLCLFGLALALGIDAPFSRVPARFGFWIVWGLLLAAAAGWRRWRPSPKWAAAALLFVLADLGPWAARWVYAADPAAALAPAAGFIEAMAGRRMRFLSAPEIANPNKAMLYRAENVNGYEAFYLGSYLRYAARAEGGPAGDPSRTYLRRADAPEMRRLGVGAVLGPRGGAAHVSEIGGQFPLVYTHVGPGAPAAARGAPFMRRRPEHWTARAVVPAGPAPRLIFAVVHYPGWRAFIDGRPAPVERFDGLLSAISLAGRPAGAAARVDLRFTPTLWPLWVLLTLAGWLTWSARRWREAAP